MTEPCSQLEKIGKFEEFMSNFKGLRTVLTTIAIAILLQVGTFLYLWGGLITTVNKNTEHLWKTLTPTVADNTRNIDRVMTKLENIKIIGYANAQEKK